MNEGRILQKKRATPLNEDFEIQWLKKVHHDSSHNFYSEFYNIQRDLKIFKEVYKYVDSIVCK